jgi:uncharacterized protein with NRDE domain
MCIVVFRWQPDSDEPLVLAANRDEFFARPTAALHWWNETDILAGRDGKSGGTWMGVTRRGRFALLTNLRDPRLRKPNAPSRGMIVNAFLEGDRSPQAFLTDLSARAAEYEGFNFVCGSLAKQSRFAAKSRAHELWFLNSTEAEPRRLVNGVYALSNASLDTPWPKTLRIKQYFAAALQNEDSDTRRHALDSLLLDDTRATDDALPETGVPRSWEQALSSIFIRHRDDAGNIIYGTRSSSQWYATHNYFDVHETTHIEHVQNHSRARVRFNVS